jgi:hypothetical protein
MFVCLAGCRRVCEILGRILKSESNGSIRNLKCCVRLLYRTVITNMTKVRIFVVTFGELIILEYWNCTTSKNQEDGLLNGSL